MFVSKLKWLHKLALFIGKEGMLNLFSPVLALCFPFFLFLLRICLHPVFSLLFKGATFRANNPSRQSRPGLSIVCTGVKEAMHVAERLNGEPDKDKDKDKDKYKDKCEDAMHVDEL